MNNQTRALLYCLAFLLISNTASACLWNGGIDPCPGDCANNRFAQGVGDTYCATFDAVPYQKQFPHDAQQWQYHNAACDYNSIEDSHWCKSAGGVYSNDFNHTCTGLPPDRIGARGFSSEETSRLAIPSFLQYVWFGGLANMDHGCGMTPLSIGAPWNEGEDQGPNCYGGAGFQRFVGNLEVQAVKSTKWNVNYRHDPEPPAQSCLHDKLQRFSQLRIRNAQCPLGYSVRTSSQGTQECFAIIVDNPCGLGAHVMPANGQEMIHHVDLRFGSIIIERDFNSYSGVGVDGPEGSAGKFTAHAKLWRSPFERRLVTLPGTNGSPTAAAYRPNGQTEYYLANGNPLIVRPGAASKLAAENTEPGASWSITTSDDSIEYYDASGRFIKWQSQNGSLYKLTYVAGQLGPAVVTDEHGRSLSFDYDSTGRIERIRNDAAQLVVYSYDLYQRLVTVRYADGSGILYHYESEQWMEVVTGVSYLANAADSTGLRYVTYSYDDSGRMFEERLAPGTANDSIGHIKLKYDYPIAGHTQITTPTGRVVDQEFALVAGAIRGKSSNTNYDMCGSREKEKTYDNQGHLQSVTDFAGTRSTRSINDRGLEELRVEAASTAMSSSPLEKRTIQTEWHPTFREPVERNWYNADGTLEAKTNWTYNTRGQVLSVTMTDPANNKTRSTTYAYCEAADLATNGSYCPILGLLKFVDGPRTDVADKTTYYYRSADDIGCSSGGSCAYRKGDLWITTDALDHTRSILSYDAAGHPTRTMDENNVVTDLEYDARGRLTARKLRGSNNSVETDDAIWRFTFDGSGLARTITQPDNSYIEFTFDNAQRLTDIKDANGNTIHYTLDAEGHRTAEEVKDSTGSIKRNLGRIYDALGRRINETNAAGIAITTDTYDANRNLDTVIDANNVVTDRDYDPLNRLMTLIQDKGTNKINATTRYAYDARNNLVTVTDPRGIGTSYEYDGLNNLSRLIGADTGKTSYEYDDAGNQIKQTDARGIASTSTYDELNRRKSVSYPNSSLNVALAYDQPDSTTGCSRSFPIGRLTRTTDGSGSTTYCYDRFGNVTRKMQMTGATQLVTNYTYNVAGSLLGITYPSGLMVAYSRDAQGRVSRIDVKPAGAPSYSALVASATYLPFGPISTITFGDGTTDTYKYDKNYWIDSLASSAEDGLKLDFSEDAQGTIIDSAPYAPGAPSETYAYDHLYRLTGVATATQQNVESYTYDATGNRTSKRVGTGPVSNYNYSVDNKQTNRLLDIDGNTRTYDANGNLLSPAPFIRSGPSFQYDDRNRMAASYNRGRQASYYYNARGERVSKTIGANVVLFSYDEAGRLISESGDNATDYLWLGGRLAGISRSGVIYNIETDHLGTPRAIRDPARNKTIWSNSFQANPFGAALPNENPDGDSQNFIFNSRFPGQYFDSEVGLSYNFFRDYEAQTGRYAESDPIGLKGGVSTYSYVRNSPMNGIDPNGLLKWTGNGIFGNYAVGNVGWALDYYTLTSDCGRNGLRGSVKFFGTGVALGFSGEVPLKGSFYGSDVTFEDSTSNPDIEVFTGPYARDGLAATLLLGAPPKVPNSIGSIQAGHANAEWSLGTELGIDVGYTSVTGIVVDIQGAYKCCTAAEMK